MWANIVVDLNYNTNFNIMFSNTSSDILIHLAQWQYWWWFWFSFFWVLYFMLLARVLRFRTTKFRPKIVSSFRPHGKWGDLIICIIPVFWCFNILVNSNFLLKLLEWQAESSLFTIRIRGKQWYWVYKFDFKNFTDIISTPKNIGNNKWLFSFFGELKTSDNYLHIIQSRSQNKWIKNYWSQNFNKFSDDKKSKYSLLEENINFVKLSENFNKISQNNQNSVLTNNFNEKEFILDDTELHKELDLSLFNCGEEENTTNFNEEVNNNKNSTNGLLTKNINFSEISEIFKKIEQNTKNYVWLESYDEILNNFCEREFGCSVEEELDLSLFNFGQEDKKNLDNFIFCENINFSELSEIFNKNTQNKKKVELINNFCEKEFNCDSTKRDFSLFDLGAFVNGEYVDDCMWDFCTFLSSNTDIFYSNSHESSINFNEIFEKSSTLLKDFEYKNSKTNYLKIEKNCCFCEDLCKLCTIYLKNIDEFENIEEYSKHFDTFFEDASAFVKNNKENKNCFDGVCEINFEDKESLIDEKNESFNINKNNFLKNYENNFKNEIFFKNFIFSNNEENSRLSKNFSGKKKIFFLIKKDIKKINFLEKNFFFKIRFNDKNSNFNNKNSSNSTYFTFKQKRYKRRTQIQKFLKNYKNIENKDLIFNGFLNLNEDNVLDDNIKNPTKYYRMLRKNRLRGEDMPVSISKRLLRVKKTLVIPTNINITAITNSYDVVHSWFIPGIGLKMDCVPGRSTHHTFYVDNAGFYYGQCAEICGRYHHHMPIRVCALPFEHFLIWWNTFGLPKIIFNKKGYKHIKNHSFKKFSW